MNPLPIVHPADHPRCPWCQKQHTIDTQDVCRIIKLAAQSDAAIARIMQRPT